MLEDVARGQRQALGPRLGHRLDGEDRVAPQREEVVVAPDPVAPNTTAAKHPRPDRRELRLDARPRRGVRRDGGGLRDGIGQRPPVELAVGQARQRRHRHPERRDHVAGQVPAQPGGERGRIRRALDPGGQPGVARRIAPEVDAGGDDAGQRREGGLDLAGLDAKAADLHLAVGAAEKVERALGGAPDPVAGAVHHRRRSVRVEGIGDEPLGGQVGSPPVALRDARAREPQLARRARGQLLPRGVEHIGPRAGKGRTEGEAPAAAHQLARGEGGVLGRPIEMPEPFDARVQDPLGERGGQRLARQADGARLRRQRPEAQQLGEGGGHGVDEGDLRREGRLRQGEEILRQQQRPPEREGAEDLEDRQVEADRGRAQHAGQLLRGEGLRRPVDQRRAVAMGERHALGPAGRAGGVDQVGEIPGRDRDGRRPPTRRDLGERRRVEGQGEVGVRRDVVDAGRGIVGIERHIGRAGLQRAEDGRHEVDPPRQGDPDPVPRPDALVLEPGGEGVGLGLQRGVGERAALRVADRRPVRGARGLGGDEAVQAARPRRGDAAGIVPAGDRARLGRVEHGERPRGRVGGADQRRGQRAEGQRHLGDRLRQEQVPAVFEPAVEPVAPVEHGEGQVDLGPGRGQRDGLPGEPRRGGRDGVVGLPDEHRLEDRVVAPAPLRGQGLDHLLEGRVRMVEGGERLVAGGGEQGREIRRPVAGQPQGEGVEEHPHQPVEIGMRPLGDGRADHRLRRAAVAPEKRREGRERRHVGRGPGGCGPIAQAADRGRVEGEVLGARRRVLSRRPGKIGGQVEEGRRAVEPRAPALDLGGEVLAALPGGVVGVTDPRTGQIGGGIGIERGEFAQGELHRLRVADDVVQRQQRHVVVGSDGEEAEPGERPAAEVEGARHLGP